MMKTTFTLDEVPIQMPNGEVLYASGELPIAYHIQPAEPDVGIMRSFAEWDLDVDEPLELACFDTDNARVIRLAVYLGDPIMRQILDERTCNRIEQECIDDNDQYGGPDPDWERERASDDRELRQYFPD